MIYGTQMNADLQDLIKMNRNKSKELWQNEPKTLPGKMP
jgi:hypothetical protein